MAYKLSRPRLKLLNLYSAFDVSQWCGTQGIQTIYLEHLKERIMEVQFVYMSHPCWVVRDSKTPGKIIKKFVLTGDASIVDIRKVAEAWVLETYDVPMKYIDGVHACFPAPAVDQITHDLDGLERVWGPMEPKKKAALTFEEQMLKHARAATAKEHV